MTGPLQDSGTAIWLFAYFGYWLEVIIVLASRGIKGSLLSAKKANPKGKELPLGTKVASGSSAGDVSPTTARANQKAAGEPLQASLQKLTALCAAVLGRCLSCCFISEPQRYYVCTFSLDCTCYRWVSGFNGYAHKYGFQNAQREHLSQTWSETHLCGAAELEQPARSGQANGKPVQMEMAQSPA